MLIVSTGFKAALFGRQSFTDIFNGGKIRVFFGARASLPEAAEPEAQLLGDILWTGFDVGLQFYQSGPFIVKDVTDSWQLQPSVSGVAAWWRLVAPGDDGSPSFTAPRMDGDIGVAGSSQELILPTTAIVAGMFVPIDAFTFTIPPVIGS